MGHSIPTVKVQREKSIDNPTGVVIINESDLTAEDELFVEEIIKETGEEITKTGLTPDDNVPKTPWSPAKSV